MNTKNTRNDWITNEILELMDRDQALNKQIQKTIKSLIRKAKENWMNSRCQELLKNDHFHVQKIKEVLVQEKTLSQ